MSAQLPQSRTGRRYGYARVSTEDQHLDLQLDALKAASCDEIVSDQAVSGSTKHRPGLDRILAVLEPRDSIVVYKLDRLGRSVCHLSDLLTQLQNRDIHFCSLSEGIDTTTPGGKLVFHMFSAIAEFERDLIAERTRHGLAATKRRGTRLGRPRALTDKQVLQAHAMILDNQYSLQDTARRLGVARSTLERAFIRLELPINRTNQDR